MSKNKLKSFYFKHDENAASDIKLMAVRSQLAMEGYGIYWFILEQLSMAGGRMQLKMVPMLASIMQTTTDKAMAVVNNYNLFVIDGDGFFSERMNSELEVRGQLSEAGRTAGLKSAEIRKNKALMSTTVERPLNELATIVQPEEKRREEDRIVKKRIEKSLSTDVDQKKQSLEERSKTFKEEIFSAGALIFTEQMLENFLAHWAQPIGVKKLKMKFEKERDSKGWNMLPRLRKWAHNNYDKIPCFLAEQKPIAQKRQEFKDELAKYLDKYHKDVLNEFYRHWSQPENVQDPKYLRWEREEFWDTAAKLKAWVEKKPALQKQEEKYRIPADR